MPKKDLIADGTQVLEELGMSRAQQNERSALCLLALLNLTLHKDWSDADPLVGIAPMVTFAQDRCGKAYAPNTRETFRRQTVDQLVAAGLALNSDDPDRSVNIPKALYQAEAATLRLLRTFGTKDWARHREEYF